MDWMAQGTRITGNVLWGNTTDDLFVEVNHGPFLVDNNVFLSPIGLRDMSEGGAYTHNLLAGRVISKPEPRRSTPYHKAHSTALAGLNSIQGGDDRFYNNIFSGSAAPPEDEKGPGTDPSKFGGLGLWVYNQREYPLSTGGNVYFGGARAYYQETGAVYRPGENPKPEVVEVDGRGYLQMDLGGGLQVAGTCLITTESLGLAKVSRLGYENPDGSRLAIDRDYAGAKRSATPTPGPFENPGRGTVRLRLW
jgi:hypothetical protein